MTTEYTQVEILVQHIGKPGIKHSAYALARRLGAQAWIKAVPPLRKWKDSILSSNGRPEIVGDEVEFEGRRFYFAAPHHVFAKARNHGIEAKICRLILDSCRHGDVCVDVGANYGFLSCIMALAVGPSGCVPAFEPAAPVAGVVSETMRRNSFDGFCKVVTAAVGSEETDAASIDSYAGRVEVPVVTIDAFMKRTGRRLAFLKIDVGWRRLGRPPGGPRHSRKRPPHRRYRDIA